MVESSIGEDERRSLSHRLRVSFVLLVGISGGLVAVQANAGITTILAASLGGTIAGIVLVWYLVRIAPWRATNSRDR